MASRETVRGVTVHTLTLSNAEYSIILAALDLAGQQQPGWYASEAIAQPDVNKVYREVSGG